jgi:alkylhydroperoxidase/carboxymuconolactone decarboxylase family protein YurZ
MHDMSNLERLRELNEGAPQAMKAFWAFDKAVFQDGAISALNKQLMALAVALTTQCAYCLEIHR